MKKTIEFYAHINNKSLQKIQSPLDQSLGGKILINKQLKCKQI